MQVAGIIAEYNPLHRGHAYHLAQAKAKTGADYVVVVMSGDYVQRGTPAIFPKHLRAKMALSAGADLVLELPVYGSTASAEGFAQTAISILDQLQVVNTVCFGSEESDLIKLDQTAKILATEPADYQTKLKEGLKNGLSFPAARSAALPDYAAVLSTPNNILAIEYCKAIYRFGASLTPVNVQRQGDDYHQAIPADTNTSATALRNLLTKEHIPLSQLESYVPSEAFTLYTKEACDFPLITEDDFSSFLRYRLIQLKSPGDLNGVMDVSSDLADRIYKSRYECESFSQFASFLKTKEMTHTRINRALLHLILDISDESKEPYARVLGFRKESTALLSELKKRSHLPLITKLADSSKLLNPKQLKALEETTNASNLYQSVVAARLQQPMIHEYSIPLVQW